MANEKREIRRYRAQETPYRNAQQKCAKNKGSELALTIEKVVVGISEGKDVVLRDNESETVIFKA